MSKGNDTTSRVEAEFFHQPQTATQRRYEALRAYVIEGESAKQVAERFGYTETSVVLRGLSRPLRQVAVCDLGHEEPTLFLGLTPVCPYPAHAGRIWGRLL